MSLEEEVRRFTQGRSDGEQVLRQFISGAGATQTNRRPGPLVIPASTGALAKDARASPIGTYEDGVEVSKLSKRVSFDPLHETTQPSTSSPPPPGGSQPTVSPEDIASHMRSKPSLRRLLSTTPTFSAAEPDSPVASPKSPMRERTGSVDSVNGNERLLDRARAKEVFDKVAESRSSTVATGMQTLDLEGVREAWRLLGLKKAAADVEEFVEEFSLSTMLTVHESGDLDIPIEFEDGVGDEEGSSDGGSGLTFEQFSEGMFAMQDRGLFSFRKGSMSTETHADRVENVRRKRRVSVKPAGEQAQKVQQTLLKMRSPERSLSKSPSGKGNMLNVQDVFRLWGPEDAYIIGFDFAVTVVLLTTIISMPLCLAFEEVNEAMFWSNFLVDCIFIADIIKNFNTGFRDEDDILIMDRKRVRDAYLKGWFIPDLFSSLPMDAALKWSGGASGPAATLAKSTKIIKMLRLVRLAKVFRLMKASKVFHLLRSGLTELEDTLKIKVSEGTLKLYRLGLILVIVAHWMGCLNFMIVRMNNFPAGSWAENVSSIHCFPFRTVRCAQLVCTAF